MSKGVKLTTEFFIEKAKLTNHLQGQGCDKCRI